MLYTVYGIWDDIILALLLFLIMSIESYVTEVLKYTWNIDLICFVCNNIIYMYYTVSSFLSCLNDPVSEEGKYEIVNTSMNKSMIW